MPPWNRTGLALSSTFIVWKAIYNSHNITHLSASGSHYKLIYRSGAVFCITASYGTTYQTSSETCRHLIAGHLLVIFQSKDQIPNVIGPDGDFERDLIWTRTQSEKEPLFDVFECSREQWEKGLEVQAEFTTTVDGDSHKLCCFFVKKKKRQIHRKVYCSFYPGSDTSKMWRRDVKLGIQLVEMLPLCLI